MKDQRLFIALCPVALPASDGRMDICSAIRCQNATKNTLLIIPRRTLAKSSPRSSHLTSCLWRYAWSARLKSNLPRHN